MCKLMLMLACAEAALSRVVHCIYCASAVYLLCVAAAKHCIEGTAKHCTNFSKAQHDGDKRQTHSNGQQKAKQTVA